jgi:uncharacterized membrane protein
MSLLSDLHDTEKKMLAQLRTARREHRKPEAADNGEPPLTVGQKIADVVAATMGSWTFIIIQSVILLIWIVLNLLAVVQHWDPYPFILLNLALSFQAAYAAPFIMMSQNRQQDIDRRKAEDDYNINIKAELEIELVHQKLDELREKEILLLTQTVADLTVLLKQSGLCGDVAPGSALPAANAEDAPAVVAKAPEAKPAAVKKPAATKPAAGKPETEA